MVILVNEEGRVGLAAGLEALRRGAPALDVVEAAIRPVEADPSVHSVGRGGWTNLLGASECDATIIEGRSRRAGSVAALRDHLHAISVARQVLERLPHVLLVGEGATRFAREIGAEPAEMVTEEARADHQAWVERNLPPGTLAAASAATMAGGPVPLAGHAWSATRDVIEKGTTICLVIDAQGEMAAGVSSSGWAYKYPGRVGDSGVLGAGLYADLRYGACGCTHTGEMTLRAGTARSVVLAMQRGATVEEACLEAIEDLRALDGGLLGVVTVHAIDRQGRPCVVCTHAEGSQPGFLVGSGAEAGEPPVQKARAV